MEVYVREVVLNGSYTIIIVILAFLKLTLKVVP